jgi:hypothetical protein
MQHQWQRLPIEMAIKVAVMKKIMFTKANSISFMAATKQHYIFSL